MTSIPRAPSELTLEHTTDEHSEVRARIRALRARGQDDLADRIERAYTATARGGLFVQRATPPPPTRKRSRR